MSDPITKLAIATERLNAFTDRLALLADWKEALEARLERATVRFEGDGLDAAELDCLTDEVHAFRGACFALADSIGSRRKEAA